MTCEELREDYPAWALGIAEDPARSDITDHLSRNCPVCLAGIRSANAAVAAMSSAVKEVDPPRRLRGRIAAMVTPESSRSRWAIFLPWGLVTALAIVLLSVALPGRGIRNTNVAKLEQALSILNDPATKDVSFGEPAARGRVFVSPNRGVVFIAARLPKLESNRTFEMWVIPATGKPIPAGTFRGESDSTAVYVRPGPVEDVAAVAVTIEPEGGSPQPTTTPFVVSKL